MGPGLYNAATVGSAVWALNRPWWRFGDKKPPRRFDLGLYASDEGLAAALQDVLERQAIPCVAADLQTDPEDSSGGQLVFDPAPFLSRMDNVVEVFSFGSRFGRLSRAGSSSGLARRLLRGEELRPHVRGLEIEAVLLPDMCAFLHSFPLLRSLAIEFDNVHGPDWPQLNALRAVDCPALQTVSLRSIVPRQVAASDVARILKKFLRPGTAHAIFCSQPGQSATRAG
ncbi:hypothetical protein AURDEDRAFT_172071 [Auricularia subglabra TFB-10046 SS5]|nr:hypothetical protein AURDEDRAFT_172071 [Auricularia subglabra TFB-10046 SS5]